MKILWYLRVIIVIFVVLGDKNARAFDLATFYRAPFFQSIPTKKTKNWTTELSVRIAGGNAHSSFGEGDAGDRTALFNSHGPFKLASLGLGIDDITVAKPVTNNFWGTNGVFSNVSTVFLADGTQPEVASTELAPNNLGSTDGNAIFGGRFRTTEVDLELHQNLVWGFYAHVFVPFKDLKIDRITARNVGPATVLGQNMNTFITNSLPIILTENGIKPYDQPFTKSGIADASISGGWQGSKEEMPGIITSLSGLMQAGVLLPLAPKRNEDTIFALPLSYNGHWGTVVRGALQVGLWKILSIGAQGGSTIFFTHEHNMRMETDKTQNGWLALEKGHVHVDQGSIWDAGIYASVDQLVQGFAFMVGYSFTRQEETILKVEDDNFLSTVQADALMLVPNIFPNDGRANRFIFTSDIVNSDSRLRGWETHTLHFVMSYDMMARGDRSWGPLFKIEYSYPVAGKFSWATDMIAGTLGISATFDF